MSIKARRLALAALVALGAMGPELAATSPTPVYAHFSGGLLDGLPSYVPRDPFSGQSLQSIRETPKKMDRNVKLRSSSVTDVNFTDHMPKVLASVPSYRPQEPFS